MKAVSRVILLVLALAAAGSAWARSDTRDGNAMVKPVKADRYELNGTIMGKAELYGYIGDLRDSDHLTGVVLKRGGNDEQRHVIGSIARALQLKAFEQDGGDLKPIDLPPNPPAAAVPAVAPVPAVPPVPPAPAAEPTEH